VPEDTDRFARFRTAVLDEPELEQRLRALDDWDTVHGGSDRCGERAGHRAHNGRARRRAPAGAARLARAVGMRSRPSI